MKRLILVLALSVGAVPAWAQNYTRQQTPDPGQYVPVFAQACQDGQGRALPPGSPTCVAQTQVVSGTVTSNQGTPNTGGAQAWPVQWSGQSVAVSSLPAVTQGAAGTVPWLVTWSNQSVAVSSLPSLPAGTNTIGAVTQSGGPWSVSGTVAVTQSGTWNVGLNAGTAAIGTVGVTSLPSIPAGSNAIGSVTVSNFPGTQPVSAASLPLPTGAATAANQANTSAGTSATTAQGVQGVTGGVPLPIQGGNGTAVKVDGSGVTQPVSAASLPLPTGASTAAGQAAQQGPVAPGAASSNSVLGATVYNSTAPAPTNGQQLALQADAAGNLKINNATLSPGAATLAGQTLTVTGNGSSAAGFSSLAGGVYNATAPSLSNGQQTGVQLDAAGNLKVNTTGAGGATAANQTATQNVPGTSGAKADAVQGVTGGVPVPVAGGIWWQEANGASAAAGASVTGAQRTNSASGAGQPYGYFTAVVSSSQPGTLYLGNAYFNQTAAVAAGTPTTLKVAAIGPSLQAVFIASGSNSSAATVTLLDAFTVN